MQQKIIFLGLNQDYMADYFVVKVDELSDEELIRATNLAEKHITAELLVMDDMPLWAVVGKLENPKTTDDEIHKI